MKDLLQNTTHVITIYDISHYYLNNDNESLQFTIGTLLQITTAIITIFDRYYNSRQLLLQFTTGITIHDAITIHRKQETGNKRICQISGLKSGRDRFRNLSSGRLRKSF